MGSVRVRFVPETELACGLAIDQRHMYWINQATQSFGGGLGRASLDGTGADQTFIVASPPPNPEPTTVVQCGVAVDSAHVYWATDPHTYQPDLGVYTDGPLALARANLDGSQVNQAYIPDIAPHTDHLNDGYPTGSHDLIPAIGVHASYIYWANFDAGTIGRANLDGSAVNPNLITGAWAPRGIAFDATHIYWTNSAPDASSNGNTIGRANLDGTGVQQRFISGLALGIRAGSRCSARISTGAPTASAATGATAGLDAPTLTAAMRSRSSFPPAREAKRAPIVRTRSRSTARIWAATGLRLGSAVRRCACAAARRARPSTSASTSVMDTNAADAGAAIDSAELAPLTRRRRRRSPTRNLTKHY